LQLLRYGLADTPWAAIQPAPIHFLGLMAFFLAGDELDALLERLNLRADQRRLLRQVYTIRRNGAQILAAPTNSALYHLLAGTGDDARLIAWLGLDHEEVRRKLVHFQTTLRGVSPIIDGDYLKAELRLPAGPMYRRILDTLRDARLDGLATTLADERALAEQLIAGG
jgi:hypothetical protein